VWWWWWWWLSEEGGGRDKEIEMENEGMEIASRNKHYFDLSCWSMFGLSLVDC
jgi:hypothetical protein